MLNKFLKSKSSFFIFLLLIITIFYFFVEYLVVSVKETDGYLVNGNMQIKIQANSFTNEIEEYPVIDNITIEVKEVPVEEDIYLNSPTVSVSNSETWGYIGLDSDDDSNTATYYTTTMVSASSSDYDLDKYYFRGNSTGTYKLQYKVFLIRYNKNEDMFAGENITEENQSLVEAGKLFTNNKGQLCYKAKSGTVYYVYLEENLENGEYELNIYSNILGFDGSSLKDDSLTEYENLINNKNVKLFVRESDIQTITVKDIVITVDIDDDAYAKTQYPEVGQKLDIIKPSVVVSGDEKGNKMNEKDSYVQISVTSGSTTQTLATISFDEWQEAVDNDNNFEVSGNSIKLLLNKNGKYTIKYSIQAQDRLGQNVGDAKTLEYTILNGDIIAPEINLDNNFVKSEYEFGEILILDINKMSVTDNVTTDKNKLLNTMLIKLTNENTGETWILDNTSEVEGFYSYEHKFKSAGDYILTVTVKDEADNSAERTIMIKVNADNEKPSLVFDEDFINSIYFLGDIFVIDTNGLMITDNVTTDRKIFLSSLEVELVNQTTGNKWILTGLNDDTNYKHLLNECGTYLLTIKVKDEAQNVSIEYKDFEVKKYKNYVIDFNFLNNEITKNMTIMVNGIAFKDEPINIDGGIDDIKIELKFNDEIDFQLLMDELIRYNASFSINYLNDCKYEITIDTINLNTNELCFTLNKLDNNGQKPVITILIVLISLIVVFNIILLIHFCIKRKSGLQYKIH